MELGEGDVRGEGVEPGDRVGYLGDLEGAHGEADVVEHGGGDRAGRDDVDGDAVALDFFGQGGGEGVEAGLGGRVGGAGGVGGVGRDRGEEDQTAARGHGGEDGVGDHEGGRQVGAEDVLEGIDRLLADEGAGHHARGVDHEVDRAGLDHHAGEGVGV